MGEFRVGGRRRGGEDVVPGAADAESMGASSDSGASSGSLCSSIMSSLTDDDAESSPVAGDPTPSPPSDTMQLDGGGGGPLYELSPLLAHLPVRTGLSKYYKGKSQSFTSLSDVKCLQDLAKKTTAHTGRKASRSSISLHVQGPHSKTIGKKTPPRGSSGRLPSRAWSRGLPHRSGKPPAYQSKKELCSRDFC
ncbi:uncharacterized protein LOC119337788 [Triticum dicoccoides]|uniref:Oxidative stress 3 n=1 Tax=Triticum turgidum subsp. durum TaxID=4567 RepID=A0A9R1A5D6_TRITD|nr:uncharacterized protein LOC119337788 [Triticum dicoccoides]XP_044432494.1 uncharacterized protein LOC123158652 [Triticum aestivum]VAI89840.1 unnamed protein product [Triticum turgidum subsp. durum]